MLPLERGGGKVAERLDESCGVEPVIPEQKADSR